MTPARALPPAPTQPPFDTSAALDIPNAPALSPDAVQPQPQPQPQVNPAASPTVPAAALRPRAALDARVLAGGLLLALLAAAALALAWNTQGRLRQAEQELARRQQESAGQAVEARALSRAAQDSARDSAAKVALLEARVAENTIQRGQLDDLLQSLSRSRDENILADVDAALRVALQQTSITGSSEPLAAALRQTDERLARYQQPRLERVRRAVLQDLDRVRAAGGLDLPSLTLRIDEVVRQVDELPLVSATDRRVTRRGDIAEPAARPAPPGPNNGAATGKAAAATAGAVGSAATAGASGTGGTAGIGATNGAMNGADMATPAAPQNASQIVPESAITGQPPSPASTAWAAVQTVAAQVWAEVRSLVRVTRVANPEAALLVPEQAYFLRENLKLRLLNARLALLSRQFDTAQADLREAQSWLDRYFDRSSRRVVTASEALRQVALQARQVTVPRPDATLAAVAAATAGR